MINGQTQPAQIQAMPQNGRPPVPAEPKVLSHTEDYIQTINALQSLLAGWAFPAEYLVAPRMEASFKAVKDFVQSRLDAECQQGMGCCSSPTDCTTAQCAN